MGIALNRYQFTVDDFHFLAEQGKFRSEARLELIEGQIYEMSPIGSLHARCVNFLNSVLSQRSEGKFIVSGQNPIVVNDLNEPQPDIAILRYKEDFYKDALPTAEDTLLVIEVADTSVFLDRNIKFPKYASAGIPEAWLVDLQNDCVEIHTEPIDSIYSSVEIYQRGKEIVSKTMPEIKFNVDGILG